MRLFYERMGTFLGLLGIIAYIVCVIAIAAAITWLVVKYTPTEKAKPKPEPPTA